MAGKVSGRGLAYTCMLALSLCLVASACGSTGGSTTITVTAGASGGSTPSESGPSSTLANPTGPQVAGAGFSEYVSSGDRQLDFYALVKNPNSGQTFDQAEVDFDFLSKDGTVVDSEQEYATFILPGQSFPVVGSAFNPPATPIAKLRVRIGEPFNWIDASDTSQLTAKLTQLHLSTSFGLYEAKGVATIQSTFSHDIKSSPVVFLYFDSKNRFVGYDQEYANFVPAGGKAQQSFDDFPHKNVRRVVPYAGLDHSSSVGSQSLL